MKCPGSVLVKDRGACVFRVTIRRETNQRRGHRYSNFSSRPERNIDYRDQIVIDYRDHSHGFELLMPYTAADGHAYSIAVGDVNGDGIPDIIIGTSG